ncbi:MAG: gliding motility-associated ABC transporter ATP-binding subunit GldA [bacterium]|nr:gliding motility-associated ABC transporter ATP-binding subunit GldA [bacterium]
MSIQVSNLSKVYGEQKAVDQISFTAEKGKITGFLGPNGAGKSTTMKIATGYIPPTDGEISVCGLDVVSESLATRKKIGYLPEHNPLYLDMYVHEYLAFIGNANGLKGSNLKSRIQAVIELCGLQREQNKLIGSLSKGYRQRVGLAQALIHDPEVLILDEPTTGLDPNQILEIRKVIKSISKEKTIIFSTHIMQEVQALCDWVVIINKGKIVANESMDSLRNSMADKQYIILEFSEPCDIASLTQLKGIVNHEPIDDQNHCKLEVEKGADLRNEILKVAAENNLPLVGIKQDSSSLEEMFHNLTKS